MFTYLYTAKTVDHQFGKPAQNMVLWLLTTELKMATKGWQSYPPFFSKMPPYSEVTTKIFPWIALKSKIVHKI